MYYTFDAYGRFAGISPAPTGRCTDVAPPEQSADYNWTGIDWVYAPNIPTVPVVPVAQDQPPKLTPVEFKMCFTVQERIAIKTARPTDPVLDDAMELLEDIRLKEVDLSLQSNRQLIDYMVSQSYITPERAEQIKAGVTQ